MYHTSSDGVRALRKFGMTQIGDILDSFFSPFSQQRLWVMPETDSYTVRVRDWNPVKESVARIKAALSQNCSVWTRNYPTNPTWTPVMSDALKPGAYRDHSAHPPGTDPDTCKSAFVLYMTTKLANANNPFVDGVQSRDLYLCSIGSFSIYATVDAIDCTARTATINFWMYNSMSQRSFGRFASHPVFALSGMETQFMWWNWVEDISWSATGSVATIPRPASDNGW